MTRSFNFFIDIVCSLLFSAGWWAFIDGCSFADSNGYNAGPFYLYLPGIFATIGLFILNNIRDEVFAKEASLEDMEWWEKALIFLSSVLHLTAVIESIWVYCGKHIDEGDRFQRWRGASSIVQSILITLSSLGWRFLWSNPDEL